MVWTKERLMEVASHRLNGAKLVVVSNCEPFTPPDPNARAGSYFCGHCAAVITDT
jgi:hypothetical protein